MISGKNLTKKFDDRTLFSNVDFKLSGKKKIGLVGRNGCGKSTLFKMIMGEEDITSGSISKVGEKIGYIPQEFDFPDEMVGIYLEEVLDNSWEYYKIDKLAKQLQFTHFDPYQNLNTLSEGQKMKVKLMELMLQDPTILLIDEPTNHLDIEGIEWFEKYVKTLQIPVLMISHDRQFLNNVVDEIWEIEREGLIRYVGNYDNYKEEKLKLIDKWNEEFKAQERKRAQLERLLENVRKIGDGHKRSRAVSSAKTRIARLDKDKKEKYEKKVMKNVKMYTEVHSSKLMLRLTDLTKYYGKTKVFENLNLEIRGGEKVWLFGPNGAGKSTLVKIVMGLETPTAGEVKVGENIKIGYFSQIQERIKSRKNIKDEFIDRTNCFYGAVGNYLSKFLFSEKDITEKLVSQLSPGERARFEFAIFSFKDYDLLILDEPDNHLDIETKEVLEQSLRDYKGTILLVSHDRYFVGNSGITSVLNLKDGVLKQN
jgi:ATPase subunit of ABC transporter with duplicated ATPase domains